MLHAVAHHLPPTARLNLACANKALFQAVWGNHAAPDIVRRFPIERRTTFNLTVYLDDAMSPTSDPSALRTVPARSRQQHLNVAVNPTGTLVAVLPYDNILRLVCPRRCAIVAQTDIPVFSNDVWDVHRGLRRPQPRPACVVYADDAGLDIETCLDFSPDGRSLVIASRDAVRFYHLRDAPHTPPQLVPDAQIHLADALTHIAADACGTGGAANVSPDGLRLAWVVFEGKPATVHVTLWRRATRDAEWRHDDAIAVDRVWTRRWAALAWARPVFTPNSRYLVLVVNCAHKETRVVNVNGEFQRTKLCRFELMRVDFAHNSAVVRRTEWLDLAPDVYPKLLAEAVSRLLDSCVVHDAGTAFAERIPLDKRPDRVTAKQLMRMPGLAFNSVHSCPAEATYKGLSFGKARHPWFVSKQPMFSFHFSPSGSRVVLATSPHCNVVRTLVTTRRGGDSNEQLALTDEEISGRRRMVFKMMPWRAAFAAITAFSTSGQWLVGAALLDDDRCCVCVRNVTLREYFGEQCS